MKIKMVQVNLNATIDVPVFVKTPPAVDKPVVANKRSVDEGEELLVYKPPAKVQKRYFSVLWFQGQQTMRTHLWHSARIVLTALCASIILFVASLKECMCKCCCCTTAAHRCCRKMSDPR